MEDMWCGEEPAIYVVHQKAEVEMDPCMDWKPVTVLKRWRDVVTCDRVVKDL